MDRKRQLEQLRLRRTSERLRRREADLSLGFMAKQFKAEVERPWKKVEAATDVWMALLPSSIAERTRLQGLDRGVLRVGVSDSATLYELDRLLRGGVQRELQRRVKGGVVSIRKIRLSLDPLASRHDDEPEMGA
ncbi:DciA family protein [Mucisphaera calidilacus]|uniref:DUF721 domain-containing protein n=1 Tax=Mucisphaera calidilacus TaxID=2527982 RepID=A0A518BZ86_9BACT|nr:DciA family protein [Mucisphaera calidilacus]QDU72283.1 hypothetical protein Pan265_21470 [Mucisphaera calidilacus]